MNHCLPKGMSQEQIGDMDNPAAYFAIIPHFPFQQSAAASMQSLSGVTGEGPHNRRAEVLLV